MRMTVSLRTSLPHAVVGLAWLITSAQLLSQESAWLRITPAEVSANTPVEITWSAPDAVDALLSPVGPVPPAGTRTYSTDRSTTFTLIAQDASGRVTIRHATLDITGVPRDILDNVSFVGEFQTTPESSIAGVTLPAFLMAARRALEALADRPAVGPIEDSGALIIAMPRFEAPELFPPPSTGEPPVRRTALKVRARALPGTRPQVAYSVASLVEWRRRSSRTFNNDPDRSNHATVRDLFNEKLTERLPRR